MAISILQRDKKMTDAIKFGWRRRAAILGAFLAVFMLRSGDASATHQTTSAAASSASVYNPYLVSQSDPTRIRIYTVAVFGDSYSDPNRRSWPNWAEQIRNDGSIKTLYDYAKSGAKANYGSAPSLNQQIDSFFNARVGHSSRDLTIIYMGYNDITQSAGINTSKSEYARGLDRLISAGWASGNARILLVLGHDWSRNPGSRVSAYHTRMIDWNNYVAGLAAKRKNVIAVDLFTVMEQIYGNPGKWGIVNTTGYNETNALKNWLYADSLHYGQRGHQLIAQTIKYYLTTGWNWSNTQNYGSSTVNIIKSDTQAMKVAK